MSRFCYCEPEGPFGEYMGYYGAIHMDPIFTCTAITMRSDVLHHTLLHGSAFAMERVTNDPPQRGQLRGMSFLEAAPLECYMD